MVIVNSLEKGELTTGDVKIAIGLNEIDDEAWAAVEGRKFIQKRLGTTLFVQTDKPKGPKAPPKGPPKAPPGPPEK